MAEPFLYGPPEALTESTGGLAEFGLSLGLGGMLMGTVGAFYSAKSAQYQAKTNALSLDFAAEIAAMNASRAEQDAQAAIDAGTDETARTTAAYGQAKANDKVSAAARGVQVGVGSAAETQASIELAKQIDALTIRKNTLRQASALRAQAVNYRTEARLSRVSAANMRRTGRSISPLLAAGGSLLTNATPLALGWASYRRGR